MIRIDLKDLWKPRIYIFRYGGNQFFKTTSSVKAKQLIKALKVLNILDYHIYIINVKKVSDIDNV